MFSIIIIEQRERWGTSLFFVIITKGVDKIVKRITIKSNSF